MGCSNARTRLPRCLLPPQSNDVSTLRAALPRFPSTTHAWGAPTTSEPPTLRLCSSGFTFHMISNLLKPSDTLTELAIQKAALAQSEIEIRVSLFNLHSFSRILQFLNTLQCKAEIQLERKARVTVMVRAHTPHLVACLGYRTLLTSLYLIDQNNAKCRTSLPLCTIEQPPLTRKPQLNSTSMYSLFLIQCSASML